MTEVKDIYGDTISVTCEGRTLCFWRPYTAAPFLTLDADEAYRLAGEIETAVEDVYDGL